MNNLNYVFFDTFASLDKLCGQLYNENHGVTDYIEDMKTISWNNYRHIPNWETDLEKLKRLRHIRNTLAHEPSAFREQLCTQADIDWLESFHKRILNRTDPMALLRKQLTAIKQAPKHSYSNSTSYQQPKYTVNYQQNDYSPSKEKFPIWPIILLVTGVILAILAIGIILY